MSSFFGRLRSNVKHIEAAGLIQTYRFVNRAVGSVNIVKTDFYPFKVGK
jgi:hypothetical protein